MDFKNKRLLKSLCRGLIDTDGSIFRMSKKRPNLIRINFKNNNERLLQAVRKSFRILGFHSSKVITKMSFIYLGKKK